MSACRYCGADLGETARDCCDGFCSDPPEVRAENERQALAHLEQQPGGIAAELERRAWRRRLAKALRDGRDLEGPAAVHDAIMEIRAELGIKGKGGRKRGKLTRAQLNAIQYAAKELNMLTPAEREAGKKAVNDDTLARIARMQPQNFSREFAWSTGTRWVEFWSAVINEADK